jgi:SAM-dependent methyltransferase
MKLLSDRQKTQEAQYFFPYHHLCDYDHGVISFHRFFPWVMPYLGRMNIVVQTLKSLEFNTFLDVGCGDGKLLEVLSGTFPDKSFMGIDYSEKSIMLAKALCAADNVEWSVEDILQDRTGQDRTGQDRTGQDRTGQDRTFDVISLIEVIEHIPPADMPIFLLEVKKRLSDDGIVLCTVPSVNMPLSKKHYQHFTIEKLRDYFHQADFHVRRVEMIDGNPLLLRLARRLIVNRFWMCNCLPAQNVLFKFYVKRYLRNQSRSGGQGIYVIAAGT